MVIFNSYVKLPEGKQTPFPSPWPSPPPSAGEPRPRVPGVPGWRRRVVARGVVNNGRHGARRGGPPAGVGFVNRFLAPVVYMH